MPHIVDKIIALDRPLKKIGGTSPYRPDIIIDFGHMYVILEFDENQHWFYVNEDGRNYIVINNEMFIAKPVVMLRFNGDAIKGYLTKVSMRERENIQYYILERLLSQTLDIKHHCIFYICYSGHNPNITTTFAHKVIYSLQDVDSNPWLNE